MTPRGEDLRMEEEKGKERVLRKWKGMNRKKSRNMKKKLSLLVPPCQKRRRRRRMRRRRRRRRMEKNIVTEEGQEELLLKVMLPISTTAPAGQLWYIKVSVAGSSDRAG